MSWTERYSKLDRLVHRAAFAGVGLQKAIADIEDTAFASRFASVPCERPVFVTSLPRAGTTLLLELLAMLPTMASHTYRNMPFLLCPLMWDQLSRGFRREGEAQERAHGDGVMIDYDSPEAFEEALWRAWWPTKCRDGRIALWSATDEDEAFEDFFRNHMRKIVALRRERGAEHACRYLSKNNGNVARVPLLARMFPNATIVVPVREPRAHVASLHRQHLRFLAMHAEDAFAKAYMRGIGHFDFGANLAPIDFPGFHATADAARDPTFWLDYWIAAYAMLVEVDLPQVIFVSYEALCSRPADVVAALLARLGETAADVGQLAGHVHADRREREPISLDADRLAAANEIFTRLVARGIERNVRTRDKMTATAAV